MILRSSACQTVEMWILYFYGYMNRGEHEGEAGVSLCRYSYADNKVEERLYIPVDIPYDILSQNIGNVAYLSDENTFLYTYG